MEHIAFQTANGQFLQAVNGGGGELNAKGPAAASWETFQVVQRDFGKISLKTIDGHYICAVEGGGREVVADRGTMLDWETFEMVELGDAKVALKSSSGKYLRADSGGGASIRADRDEIGAHETFMRVDPTPMKLTYKGDLEISFVSAFNLIWNDQGSDADKGVAIYRPLIPQEYSSIGDFAVAIPETKYKYNPTGTKAIAVVKDLSGTALKKPARYEAVWKDSGSGANGNCSIWRPIPPQGYVAMGLVCNDKYESPSLDLVRCVRADLVSAGFAGDEIWTDKGSGADQNLGLWMISPFDANAGEACFSAGTFMGKASHDKPTTDKTSFVFKIKIETQEVDLQTALPKPKLRSTNPPSPFEKDTVTVEARLPWFAVKDESYSDAEKASRSPFYTLRRQDQYILMDFVHNTSPQTQTPVYTYQEGFNESETTSMANSVGIKIGKKWKVAGPGGEAETSVELSYTFTHTKSTTSGSSTSTTRTFPMATPSGGALAVYSVKSVFQLFRQDGTSVGSSASAIVPESVYYASFPDGQVALTAGS